MEYYSTHINKLIEQLSHLPGIGPKSAHISVGRAPLFMVQMQ